MMLHPSVVVVVVVMAIMTLRSHPVSGVVAFSTSNIVPRPSPALQKGRSGYHFRFRTRSSEASTCISDSIISGSGTSLFYKYLPDDYDDDNSSVEIVDDVIVRNGNGVPTTLPASASSSTNTRSILSRSSSIIELHSIQDYLDHVINNQNSTTTSLVSIIRFSAPWCKVCRSTDVAWERMASKLTSASSASPDKQINFFTVNLNHSSNRNIYNTGKNHAISTTSSLDEKIALKDMLQINRVPQGIIHHPAFDLYQRKVNLHRSNLSILKKRLEQYLFDDDELSASMYNKIEDGFWSE